MKSTLRGNENINNNKFGYDPYTKAFKKNKRQFLIFEFPSKMQLRPDDFTVWNNTKRYSLFIIASSLVLDLLIIWVSCVRQLFESDVYLIISH